MGYVKNHLATLVCAVFAVVLTALWFILPPTLDCPSDSPHCIGMDMIFIMAVSIMWFLVFITWVAQKAADYNHGGTHHTGTHHTGSNVVYTSDGKKKVSS